MEEFMPPWASLLTFTGLAGLVVLSFLRGWIVPRSTVQLIIEQKDRAIDDRDKLISELQARNDALDRRNDLLAGQVHQLVSSGYASAPPPIRAIVVAEEDSGDDPDGGVHGVRTTSSQARKTPVRSKVAGNGKARRRGSSRRS